MDDDIQDGGDPAEAFDRLRGVIEGQDRELALLRRAVEGLAAERAHIDVPDYTETLGVLQQGVSTATGRINAIGQILAEAPALAITPEQMAERIVAAEGPVRDCHAPQIGLLALSCRLSSAQKPTDRNQPVPAAQYRLNSRPPSESGLPALNVAY